ncbi:hypothetical protein SAMN05444141_11164 [Pseudovibrio denitrificans]|uniref:Uncharacterized protein n=1 Tax=Pseudovibrio denitrificans TaxID=258256 RepID=A0A1I7DVB2_9HYPH|nr:hypothetical protein SAMN05444141_11164 [Pseudovibrio denitrificans]
MTSLSLSSSSVGLQVLQRALFLAPLVCGLKKRIKIGSAPIRNAAVFHSEVVSFGVPLAMECFERPPVFCIKRYILLERNIPRQAHQLQIAILSDGLLLVARQKDFFVRFHPKCFFDLSSFEKRNVFNSSLYTLFVGGFSSFLPRFVSVFVLCEFIRKIFEIFQVVPGPFCVGRINKVRRICPPDVACRWNSRPIQSNGTFQFVEADLGLSLCRASKKGECNE